MADKRRYVQGGVAEIFDKDIRCRVKIRDKETFETVRRFIVNNFGATTSLANLCDELRKNGSAVTKQTVARYVKALFDAKILYECDFILRDPQARYAYVQVAYTIAAGKETEDREYRPLESIKDNYPRFVVTTDYLLQQRNGIRHVNLMDFMKEGKLFH